MTPGFSSSPPTILDAIRWATTRLASIDSPRLAAELLLGHVLRLRRLDLYLKFDRPLDPMEFVALSAAVDQRLSGMPVQYITGTTEFFSLPFFVTPSVLIPRPETEILVEQAINVMQQLVRDDELDLFRQDQRRMALDIGTGAGVIAICLARQCPPLSLYASDISSDALAVARRNAEYHGVADRITFLTGLLFEPLAQFGLEGTVDLIVSNPPYIPRDTLEHLPREVRDFEPHLALDGGIDGMEIHRRIIEEAPRYLKSGGTLMMEMGADQSASLYQAFIAHSQFHSVTVIKDYNKMDRVISAVRIDVLTRPTRRPR